MSDLELERHFPQPPEHVFAFVTVTENLLKWWGPEGMNVKEHNLDLSHPGPWTSTLVNAEGTTYTMSGEVTAVDAPRAVEFTWGWHDDTGTRGHESQVRFEVHAADAGGSLFRLIHTGLPDAESADNHMIGWTSSLRCLEQALA